MKISLESKTLLGLLGYSYGGEFGTLIGPRARFSQVAALARAVVNHAVSTQHIMEATTSAEGKKLATLTGKQISESIRGWCGNEPRPLPFPIPWPWPPDPEPWWDPEPSPWKFSAVDLLVIGLELDAGAIQIREGSLKSALAGAAELAINTGLKGLR